MTSVTQPSVILSATPQPTVPEIDVHTLAAWLAEGVAVAVDVREDEEWEEVCLTAAHLRPMSEFESDELPDRAGRRLVIVCKAGVRSLAIARKLVREGHGEVYNLTGGMTEWEKAGLPVARGLSACAA